MILLKCNPNICGINKFYKYQKKINFNRKISIFSWWKNKPEEIQNVATNNGEFGGFYLPEPPNAPEVIESVIGYNHLGEATFQSLGLNSYWPTGWVQMAYEYLHVSLDMPWWCAIGLSAVCIRTVMAPLTIKLRKVNILNAEITPLMAKIEKKSKDAYLTNDYVTMIRAAEEHQSLSTSGTYKPYLVMLLSAIQLPVFMSVMIGLRQMAQLPVASLQSGGILWFTDLTLADPYYILPISTMVLFWLQIEMGADFASNSKTQSPYRKWGIRSIPIVGAAVTCNFPSALLLYWWSSSALSLVIVGAMKVPIMKRMFNIKDKISSASSMDDEKPKVGFIKEWKNRTAENKMYDTATKMDTINNDRWIKAGTSVVPKTFSYDPTKVKSKQT